MNKTAKIKIETSTVRKIKGSQIEGLDPISIFLEDFEPGQGKITIQCFDKSWTNYWGGMGDKKIDEFFVGCTNQYLIGKMSSIQPNVISDDPDLCRAKMIHDLKNDPPFHLDTQKIAQMIAALEDPDDFFVWDDHAPDVYGPEWFLVDRPTVPNPAYEYLKKVLDAAKEILRLSNPAIDKLLRLKSA